jgi:hypothetical protein
MESKLRQMKLPGFYESEFPAPEGWEKLIKVSPGGHEQIILRKQPPGKKEGHVRYTLTAEGRNALQKGKT